MDASKVNGLKPDGHSHQIEWSVDPNWQILENSSRKVSDFSVFRVSPGIREILLFDQMLCFGRVFQKSVWLMTRFWKKN